VLAYARNRLRLRSREAFRHARKNQRRHPFGWKLGGGSLVIAVLTGLVAFAVWPAHAAGGLAVDVQVSTHQSSPGTTIATPQFTTHSVNELLVAFVASDGPQAGAQSLAAVSGAGLAWTKASRANAQPGTAEIWTAVSPNILTNATVTATRTSGGYVGSFTLVSFTGADLQQAGTVAGAAGTTGAPNVSLRTTRANSWVWGVGNDWSNAVARTLGAGQAQVDQYLPAVGDTYWVQRTDDVTPAVGTTVTLNDTAPTKDTWDFAAIELIPATGPAPTPSPSATASPPAPLPSSPAPSGTTPPDFVNFLKWSDPATWGGKVPGPGDAVTIPAGKQILVDTDLPKLGGLTVLGDLAFADRPTTVRTPYIMVHGSFWMGTDAHPLTSAITLILDGSPTDNMMMGQVAMGADVFGAMGGGRIEIHGRDEGRTWTRLAATAPAGSSTLTLMDPVGWRPGDKLILASSDLSVDHKERLTVGSVSADGKTVTANETLKYAHTSTVTTFTSGAESRSVEERAEVGLLSHNLRITGPDNAPTTKFGGHIMIMAGGVLRMSNAELSAMGQIGLLGRYPIHWHYAGDGSQSLVDNVSVHDSFNRFVTIHQTNNVHVNGVVADETLGHGFFLEDGVEQHNVLTNNLVMGVRPVPGGKAIRKSDAIPSEFWISNPNNDLIGNSAAGGKGAGIWYDFNYNSDNTNIDQSIDLPFGRNENNVAHSHTFAGSDPFPNHDQASGISIEGYEGNFAQRGAVVNPVTWKNDGFGLWIDGAVTTVNPTVANNGTGLNCENTAVSGGLLVGTGTANTGGEGGGVGGLLRFYHGQCDVSSTWLAGFAAKSGSSPDLVGITDVGASTWDDTNRVRGLKFFGAGQRLLFGNDGPYFDKSDVDHSHWFADLDGSVKGDGVPAIITNGSPMIRDPRDTLMYTHAGTSYYAGSDFGFVSPADHGFIRVRFSGSQSWTRDDGITGKGTNSAVAQNHRYTIGGSRASIDFDIHGTDPGHADLVFNWTGSATPRAVYTVFGKQITATRAASASSLGDSQYFVDTSAHKLYLRLAIGGKPIPFGSGGDLSTLANPDQYWSIR
jgi:cell migration-inducing and hyaluronan-binding protein